MSAQDVGGVLVIGATGTTGRHICQQLIAKGARVTAASRSGGAPPHTHDVRFDWYDHDTYRNAIESVDRMYVIAPPGEADLEMIMRPFLELARSSGVRRAVLQSSSLIPAGGPVLGRVHDIIAELFPEWAVLRPSWFMQNFTRSTPHAVSIRENGAITTATGRGRVGFIDAHDIARVAVRTLLGAPINADLVLTGPEALSYDDVAATISRESQRPVVHNAVSYEEMLEVFTGGGVPAEFAQLLAWLETMIAEGAEDRVTDTVQQLTGSPPRCFADFAREHWSATVHCRTDRSAWRTRGEGPVR